MTKFFAALSKLGKFSFLFWSIGFALLGGLSALVFLLYLQLSMPVGVGSVPKIQPIDLSINLPNSASTNVKLPEKPITNLDDLPNTQLSIRLLGFIITDKEEQSVIVLEFNGKELTLSLNDELDSGVKLTRILPYRLVFENQGKREKFDWQEEEPKLDFVASDANPDESNSANQTGSNLPNMPEVVVSTGVAPLSSQSSSSASQVSAKQKPTSSKPKKPAKPKVQFANTAPLVEKFGEDFKNKLLKNPFQLAKYMRLSPARRDDLLIGYAVYPASDDSLFKAFKLVPGDVLLSVNGLPTNDPSRLAELMKMLSEATDLNIELEREGNPITVNLSL